jgi:tetratricopeptide (TPR) repeat protein
MAASVWRLWILSRDLAGGRSFVATVLDAAPANPSRFRALTLYGDGLFAFWKGALGESRARNEAALADARAVRDPEATALACLGMSRVELSDGHPEQALAFATEALESARPLGVAMTQSPLHMCAQAHRAAGRFDEAAALFAESLDLNRRLGDEGMVVVELHNLGHAEIRRGRVDAAERAFEECARLGGADDPYGVAMNELNGAAVAFGRGDSKRARSLLDGAESKLTKLGVDPAADDQTEIRWLRAELASVEGGRG